MSLLIKNVSVLGAPKESEERQDVFVQGDTISAIGNFPRKPADEVIDGQGAYISPGFIDIDTTSDHYLSLFENPLQEDFLRQGVTTIIGGQCGASLAPLLAGGLESIRKWADTNTLNVNWHSLGEFFAYLKKQPIGVNFGTFVGHSTIRRALTHGVLRDLTVDEISIIGHIIEQSMRDGAFGMSTGLGYVHGRGSSYKELRFFAEVIKQNGGIYSTHLRKTGDDLVESIEETKRIFEDTGVETLITHMTPLKGSEDVYIAALQILNSIPSDAGFHFSIPPFATSTLPLYHFLPKWAQGPLETMVKNVRDLNQTERLLKDLPTINGKDFVIAQALKNDVLVGKNLQDIMAMYSLPTLKKALLKLMTTTSLKAVVHYKNLNLKLIKEALRSPHALVASHAPSFGDKEGFLKSERSTSTFPQYISWAIKEKVPLQDAVKKITSIPAKKLGLKGRGVMKEGAIADLTVFRGNDIRCVVVNGKVAYENGVVRPVLNGAILRHVNV